MSLRIPRKGTQREVVLGAHVDAGIKGLTDAEGQVRTSLDGNSYRPRRVKLAEDGWLVKASEIRDGGDVWLLSVAGAAALGVPGGWEGVAVEGKGKTLAERKAVRIMTDLEDAKVRRVIQGMPGKTKGVRLAKAKAAAEEKEQKRKLREELEEAKRQAEALEKVSDPFAPAHRLFAELREMEVRLGSFEHNVAISPWIFALRSDLVGIAEDVANAAYDLMDELKQAKDVPVTKRQALPPTTS